MVRRVISFSFVLVLLTCAVIPCLAYDVVQTDADNFGFAWDNHNIIFTQNRLSGNQISVTTGAVPISQVYFYIPVHKPMLSLDFIFTLCKSTGNLSFNSADYGTIYSNAYHITATLDSPTTSWLGSSNIEGSDARNISYKVSFTTLPFADSNSYRFIRLTFDFDTGTKIYTYLSKELNQGLSGVLGNPTYTLNASQSSSSVDLDNIQFRLPSYRIGGQLKLRYYNGSSVTTETVSLAGTGTTNSYLQVPDVTVTTVPNHEVAYISNGNITGTLTPSSSSTQTDLQGTYVARDYVDTVVMSAVRSYSDQDLIQAVNTASDRNHADLGRIEAQMQEIVDHQQGLEEQGQEINGTTSQTTITNTGSTVTTGAGAVSDMSGQIASGMTSSPGSYRAYSNFLAEGFGIVLNFGNSYIAPLFILFFASLFIPIIMWMFRHATLSGDD